MGEDTSGISRVESYFIRSTVLSGWITAVSQNLSVQPRMNTDEQ